MVQELNSIINFFSEIHPTFECYYDEVPEDFKTPSFYFPPVDIISGVGSIATYKNTYILYVNIFSNNSVDSFVASHKILDLIQSRGNKIPLVNDEFKKINSNVRITSISQNTDTEQRTTQLKLIWNSERLIEKEDAKKIKNFVIKVNIKNSLLKEARQNG